MEAIILSGLPAAGKTTVAEMISKLLGFKITGGGDILREMAEERGYKVGGKEWWDTPEGVKFAKERENNPDFDKEADKKLKEKIAKGNIVVTSYTAPWITENGFKVWLDANIANRTARMSKRDGTEMIEMRQVIKVRDADNRKIYKNIYNIDFGVDKTPFDMIVDTDKMTPEEVADIIIKKYKEKHNEAK